MRLIDADEVKHTFCDNCRLHVDIDCADDCEILKMIDEQPTIEAEPVDHIADNSKMVHGHWIADARYKEQKCSHCMEFGDGKNYCSHCGARMDEEETE